MKIPKMPYGQGSFTQVGNSLRLAVQYRAKADNKVYRLTVTGKTAKECIEKMDAKKREKEQEVRKKRKVSLENPTVILSAAMTDWLMKTKLDNKKARTVDRDEVTIRNQIDGYEIGRTPVVYVTAKDIEDHISFLQNKAEHKGKIGYSFSTVKKVYELLDQFFRYFYRDDMTANPMLSTRKPTKKTGTGMVSPDNAPEYELADIVLSDDEIKRFKEVALAKPNGRTYGQSRYGAGLYFILHTFLRAGEAVALKWRDVDFEKKQVVISKTVSRVKNRSGNSKTVVITTTPKTESGTRIVVLNDEALTALNVIRERSGFTEPQDYVLATTKGKPVSEDRLWEATRNMLDSAGLMTEARKKKFGVHYLRHTGISYYLRHKVPVHIISKMAGHASIAVTTSIYYHIINDQNKDALDAMNAINSAKEKGE